MIPYWKFEFRNLLNMTQERYIRHRDVWYFSTYSTDVVVVVIVVDVYVVAHKSHTDTHIPTRKYLDLHLKQPMLAFCRQVTSPPLTCIRGACVGLYMLMN
jgi:hypothetical protein